MSNFNIFVLLFHDFETLDVFGPVEVFGRLKEHFHLYFVSEHGGIIKSTQGVPVLTEPLDLLLAACDILFIPGGMGTRKEVNNGHILKEIQRLSSHSKYLLTVCTGSGLAAKAGILDGKKATSNKKSFDWARSNSEKVNWVYESRWIKDANVYTSSGISAGIDMALAFVADVLGEEKATGIIIEMEYIWNKDNTHDPFAGFYKK
jgi:putative intracellular protease/amidase